MVKDPVTVKYAVEDWCPYIQVSAAFVKYTIFFLNECRAYVLADQSGGRVPPLFDARREKHRQERDLSVRPHFPLVHTPRAQRLQASC